MKTIIKYDNSWIDYPANKRSSKNEIFSSLTYWWLELNENSVPIRELGFDSYGHVRYAAPLGKDYGLWTDSPVSFETSDDYDQISEDDFQRNWEDFVKDE